jgi:hypothetical protein
MHGEWRRPPQKQVAKVKRHIMICCSGLAHFGVRGLVSCNIRSGSPRHFSLDFAGSPNTRHGNCALDSRLFFKNNTFINHIYQKVIPFLKFTKIASYRTLNGRLDPATLSRAVREFNYLNIYIYILKKLAHTGYRHLHWRQEIAHQCFWCPVV